MILIDDSFRIALSDGIDSTLGQFCKRVPPNLPASFEFHQRHNQNSLSSKHRFASRSLASKRRYRADRVTIVLLITRG